MAGKDCIRRGGFAGFENAEVKTGRVGETGSGPASLRHAGVYRPAVERREQKVSRLAGGKLPGKVGLLFHPPQYCYGGRAERAAARCGDRPRRWERVAALHERRHLVLIIA